MIEMFEIQQQVNILNVRIAHVYLTSSDGLREMCSTFKSYGDNNCCVAERQRRVKSET
jgi:hypothetical protein